MGTKTLILGLAMVVSLALALPGAVMAANTTGVTGSVTEGYTFSAPSTVNLGAMTPSLTPHKAASKDGSLVGNNALGYRVAGQDVKPKNAGYMLDGSGNPLTYKLKISFYDGDYTDADIEKGFLSTPGVTDATFCLYVSQLVAPEDPAAVYSITITFTVTPNS